MLPIIEAIARYFHRYPKRPATLDVTDEAVSRRLITMPWSRSNMSYTAAFRRFAPQDDVEEIDRST